MAKREIKLQGTKKEFFRQYLEVIKPLTKVTAQRQLDVLSLLLYYNDNLKNIIDLKQRNKLLFDYDTRLAIQEELKIEQYTLNMALNGLRKKGIIQGTYGHNKLNPLILIYPEVEEEVSFKFTINEAKEEKQETKGA